MEKVKKTYLDLLQANVFMTNYCEVNPENKLTLAIKKFGKQLRVILEDYNDKIDTLQILNCIVDEKTKAILKDDKNQRQFTVEGSIKLKEESKKLLKEEVEVTPVIFDGIDELILGLSEPQKEAFSGLVIPEGL